MVLETAFGRFLGSFLEAQMEPKTSKNEVRKGSEKQTDFEDDFGRQRTPPDHTGTPQDTLVAGLARPVVFVFTKLWMPPGLERALRNLLRSGRRNAV